MLEEVIDAYYGKDTEAPREFGLKTVRLTNTIFTSKREVRDKLKSMSDSGAIGQLLDLLLVSRFLERAGDQCNEYR